MALLGLVLICMDVRRKIVNKFSFDSSFISVIVKINPYIECYIFLTSIECYIDHTIY